MLRFKTSLLARITNHRKAKVIIQQNAREEILITEATRAEAIKNFFDEYYEEHPLSKNDILELKDKQQSESDD